MSLEQNIFLSLVQAGLWEKEVQFALYGSVNYEDIYRQAQEQSVVGLVAAGLEKVTDIKVPQSLALTMAGEVLQLEQRNRAMNVFVAQLIDRLRREDVYALLVKGQGIAQCYERPLWRASGDVDLFLSYDNYQKAKKLLVPRAQRIDEEKPYNLHLEMQLSSWVVELHGTLRSGLWHKIDREIDAVQNDVFLGKKVRSWQNSETQVLLPDVNEDVFFVFTHILTHFFKGGIGLRQICDWCRLLWTYKGAVDALLLERRLRRAGIKTEWMAFAALAVEYLGMPEEAMPLYTAEARWKRKASRVLAFILETGNFGQRRDKRYIREASYLKRKAISFCQNTSDSFKHAMIFPWDSCKIWWYRLFEGIVAVGRGK